MILGVYSIRDSIIGFLTPTVDQNDSAAMRNFEHAVSDSRSLLHTHAKDYDLYQIATFDSDTGVLFPITPPKMLCNALSLKGADESGV